MTRFAPFAAALVLAAWSASTSRAVDLESFEFNEGNFIELDFVANTANPGNGWSVDIDDMVPAETFNGDFFITKDNENFADNFLQIDNVTSGSRFLVATMSGWAFRNADPGEPEEIRFAFINEDTGTDGSTVTAQMQISRDNTSGNIELRGDAIGNGSTDIATELLLPTDQSADFTMVLELNKTSNTYEVFYKDGSNPSQSLGSGQVSSGRDGNSVRFVVNNNFGSDGDEFFAIDRFAVADSNPLTDLLTLEVDRTTGVMKLINATGGSLAGLQSYTLTSASGALDAAGWKTITDNYDNAAGPGDGSVDADDDWAVSTSTTGVLSEAVVGGNGGNLANNQQVVLSQAGGSWIKNPTEDLAIALTFTGGVTRTANVNFVGNGGERFEVGDLNFDGSLSAADWTLFVAGGDMDLSALSPAQAYQLGDLNNDGVNDLADFGAFKTAYEAANGAAAFAALFAVPEPTAWVLGVLAIASLAVVRSVTPARARKQFAPATIRSVNSPLPQKTDMTRSRLHRAGLWLGLAAALTLLTPVAAQAAIFEDFQFNDPNGTQLIDTTNSGTNGDDWDVDADLSNSSVLNGVFRVQNDNDLFATNFLDIPNITSGQAWIVAEIAGWNFATGTANTADFNPGELEQIRFDFLDNDGGEQGGSTVTAEAVIGRNSSGGLEVTGTALGGGTPISASPLSLSQSDPYTFVLKLDKDANSYEILANNNNQGFASLGVGSISSTRDGNSVRFVVNNNFGGVGEFFDLDRLYVTTDDPTGVVASALTLEVNTTLNTVSIRNDSSATFEIDGYTITSATGDLNFAGWNSFSDQALDAIDGPDGDSTIGNGIGETWDETGGSSDSVLSERFLLGSSTFGPGRVESLGAAFASGGVQELSFEYRAADTGAVLTGDVTFVTSAIDADFDGSGVVDGADFLAWQQNAGLAAGATKAQGDADGNGTVDALDLSAWQSTYGAGSAAVAAGVVPEPTTWSLAAIVVVAAAIARRRRESPGEVRGEFC